MSRVLSRVVLAVAMGIAAVLVVHTQSATADEPFVAQGHSPTTGTPVAGQYLVADNGVWSEPPTSYDYQWLRDGTPIPGAVDQQYLVQTADIGHTLAPFVTGKREGQSAYFTGTATTARLMTATLTIDVRRVHPAPGKARLVWVAGGFLQTERPWPTDGGTVTAYKKKDNGKLRPLGTTTVTRGAAMVRLGWKQPPAGRTKVLVCFAGNEAVAATCSHVDKVRG